MSLFVLDNSTAIKRAIHRVVLPLHLAFGDDGQDCGRGKKIAEKD
jgi:hypothetical protein